MIPLHASLVVHLARERHDALSREAEQWRLVAAGRPLRPRSRAEQCAVRIYRAVRSRSRTADKAAGAPDPGDDDGREGA